MSSDWGTGLKFRVRSAVCWPAFIPMNSNSNETKGENPLSGFAKVVLILGSAAVMLLFYAFSLLAILLLTGLIAAELALFVVSIRFLAARLIMPYLNKHVGLLVMFLKTFRLRKGVDFRISLQPEDAPALHQMLRGLCDRLELSFPQEVSLQMGDGAWVVLKGLRRGAGKTTLGVGYDLLAGMTVAEMEAVLAHEMTHAKLIQRGFRNWLNAGQARLRRLAVALWNQINVARWAKQSAHVAGLLFSVVDRLVRLSTRLVAAYSRQDEFEADRGAAALCGAVTLRSALSKLESLHRITSRLPWNERVAQLQQSSGYSQWLLEEITQGTPAQAEDLSQALFNKYSTHPLIRDRLAALPPDEKMPNPNSACAIQLLAKPDEIAGKLMTALQALLAEQEKKDSKALEKFSKRTDRGANLTSWQGGGSMAIIFGILGGFMCLAAHQFIFAGIALAAVIAGVMAVRLGRYRDRLDLPVPKYERLVKPATDKTGPDKIEARQKEITEELSARFRLEKPMIRATELARECYLALEACDYLRAHVAGRECLKFHKKSVAGALGLAVACASFKQIPTTARLLFFVQRQTGFKSFSTTWGAAWAGLLAGDWIRAEAMLEKALKLQPQQTTLIALLAIAQSRRGKIQSSIINARRACEACPGSKDYKKFFVARLLDGGYTREAQASLEELKNDWAGDLELMISIAQFHLLQRQFQEADLWATRVKEAGASAQMLVRLGKLYEAARQKEHATALYHEALASDHYPEAHLGLGRLKTDRKDKAEARQHILAALDVDKPLGKEGVGTLQILHPILQQMLWLHEPVPSCRAWIASFPTNGQPAALVGQSFTVYAPDFAQAQEHFHAILSAFQPGKPPVTPPSHHWRSAPRPMQPDGPVRPGVQGVWH